MTVEILVRPALVEDADAALFRALPDAGPEERERIQTELVRRYAGIVRGIAARYSISGMEIDELRQVGFLGLVLAIRRFDPDRGFDFAAFARPTIAGEIRRHFRDKRRWVRLPRRIQETKALLTGARETLTHRLGRAPTVAELAELLQLDEELVLEATTIDDAFVAWSLDAPLGGDESDSWTLAESLGENDDRFELVLEIETLIPLVAKLSERDRRILQLRFGDELTQAEIGRQLGYSQMHVSRILTQTFHTLREGLLAS